MVWIKKATALILGGLLVLVGVVLLVSGGEEEKRKPMHIQIDDDDPRVGETINFTVSGVHKGANVTWKLGDGTTLYGMAVTHTYNRSAFYSVVVLARWEEGGRERKERANATVSVKSADYHIRRDGDGFRNLRPLWIRGRGIYAPIEPGVSKPVVYINITIHGAVGSVGAEVDFVNETRGKILREEYTHAAYQDIQFNWIIDPEEIPMVDEESQIISFVMVKEGRCGSWEISIEVYY